MLLMDDYFTFQILLLTLPNYYASVLEHFVFFVPVTLGTWNRWERKEICYLSTLFNWFVKIDFKKEMVDCFYENRFLLQLLSFYLRLGHCFYSLFFHTISLVTHVLNVACQILREPACSLFSLTSALVQLGIVPASMILLVKLVFKTFY